jgi:hypothetical protein
MPLAATISAAANLNAGNAARTAAAILILLPTLSGCEWRLRHREGVIGQPR